MPDRRTVLTGLAAAAIAPALPSTPVPAAGAGILTRTISSSGHIVPAIGMGSWITFNVGGQKRLRAARAEVLRTFFAMGGGMIDSSPMYGTSEDVIGEGLRRLGMPPSLFSATKVWTHTRALGIRQMQASRALWGIKRFDLMQIHNLLDWKAHLETLMAWKAEGRIGHLGITTSHGRRHGDFANVMAAHDLDTVQFTYNILDREAEARLLPLAREKGQAVIVNRPFRRGALFDLVGKAPLPAWGSEIGAENWAQVFLKFIISHPAVTCAIPATSRTDHMAENMGALKGPLPDEALRARMAADVARLAGV